MKRRVDDLTLLLESWVEWRLGYELSCGTGDSPLVRFADPTGLPVYRSQPLWRGGIDRVLSHLNSRLTSALGTKRLWVLLALYGLPGDSEQKAMTLGLCHSRRTLSRIKQTARRVAAGYLLTQGMTHARLFHASA